MLSCLTIFFVVNLILQQVDMPGSFNPLEEGSKSESNGGCWKELDKNLMLFES